MAPTTTVSMIPTTRVPTLTGLKLKAIEDVQSLPKLSIDLFVIGAVSPASSDEKAKEQSSIVVLPEKLYDSSIRDPLTSIITKRKFSGAEGKYILCSHKTSIAAELGILGLGSVASTQYSIVSGFDIKSPSAGSKSSDLICYTTAIRAGKTLADMISSTCAQTVCFSFEGKHMTPLIFKCFLETLVLALTPDERFKSQKSSEDNKSSSTQLKELYIHIQQPTVHIKEYCSEDMTKKMYAIIEGVHYAKELANTPANICTTESLAQQAKEIGKAKGFECQVLGHEECLKHKMGLYLAVHSGSAFAPQFIHLSYKGAEPIKKKIALVGKGICMDTGGYNLKVGCGIETMKLDMSAAAALLGTAKSLTHLQPKHVEIHFIIPAAENMIDKHAYRPGDILTASNGITVEIGNTDAEGRLTLADALVYAETCVKPDCIIDCATLTGASMVGLGHDIGALYGTSEALVSLLLKCAKETGTSIWPLPLYKPYRKLLDSQLADMNNVASQRYGGSITAALFLKEFVKKTPWCHLDMAGPAYEASTNIATGYGTSFFTEFILQLAAQDSMSF